jgi:hypothetical protein
MFPWQTVWSPHLNFPWSGSVAQKIEPTTNWFFDSISANAGDSRIEKLAFEKASYGRQIGLITEVLLELASRSPEFESNPSESLTRLKKIKEDIHELKIQEASATAQDIEDRLKWLKRNNTTEYDSLRNRLRSLLDERDA